MERPHGDAIPAEDAEQYARLFDRETSLPRWALALDRTSVALARAQRANRRVAVFVLDDVQVPGGGRPDLGRLVTVLRDRLRPDDTIARVADLTFVVVCNTIGRDRDAASVAERLVRHSGVTCRLGIALSAPGQSAPALLNAAVKQARRAEPSTGRGGTTAP